MKANCGIELALDECVAVLNHMRRLKRSAERAAVATASSSHGLAVGGTARFNASKRIPSWNVIARENSTGSLEEDLMANPAGPSLPYARWRTHRLPHDGSDSESEGPDPVSWTRSGGPLMRTTSADKFVDFVQNLELVNNSRAKSNNVVAFDPTAFDPTSDTECDERDSSSRGHSTSSPASIVVAEGDLLQPERIDNGGIVFNVVRRSALTPASRSLDSDHNGSPQDSSVSEMVQIESLDNEMDGASSISGDDGNDVFGVEFDSGRRPGDSVHDDQHVRDG